MTREADRLAGIGHFRLQEIVEPAVDLVGDGVEQIAALGRRDAAPGALQRRARRLPIRSPCRPRQHCRRSTSKRHRTTNRYH